MSRDLDGVLSAIEGALADDEWPDAMRWSPEPERVTDASLVPFDGEVVPLPPQRYEAGDHTTPGGMYRGRLTLRDPDDPELRRHGLVEVVFATTEAQRAAGRRAADRAEADRQRAHAARVRGRVLARAQRPPRGPADDLLLFDESYLVDPAHRDEVRAEHEANLARLRELLTLTPEQLDRLGDAMRQLGAAAQQAVEQIGRAFVDLAESLHPQLDDLVDPRGLPDDGPPDPKARALWLRQNRSTGPARPGPERRPAPRRHR